MFIKEEEYETKNEIFKLENDIPKKNINLNKKNNNREENFRRPKKLEKEKIFYRNWLKYNNYSCRHDSFFFIYSFIIYPKLKDVKDNNIINMYNSISKEILKMDLTQLNNGIWNLILQYKNNEFDLSKYGFKQYYTVLQHLENMKNNKYFCIEYEMLRGCNTPNCLPPESVKEYFSTSINFNEDYITQYNITYLIDELFSNTITYCAKCQWKKGKILKNCSPKYYKNYIKINPSDYLFITFEDNLKENFINVDNTTVAINQHDVLLFNKIKAYLDKIEYILVNNFEIFGLNIK